MARWSPLEPQDDDALDDFAREAFTHEGETKLIFRQGEGPAVIVISEVPGITPRVAAFARRVVAAGFTAVMPNLFGTPGRAPDVTYSLRTLGWACIAREFSVLALRRSSPVIDWLRALARAEHARCGGPGVGVIGMCLTGNFALAMAADDSVLAPVLSQPSLPFPLTPAQRGDLHASPGDLARVKARCRDEGLCVMGLRFTGDRLVPAERFARLQRELGDAFVAVEIDSSPGNPHGIPALAHSVVTEHLVDRAGHPTRDALEQVLALFRERLTG